MPHHYCQPLGLGFLNLPAYAQNGVLLLEPQGHIWYVFAVFTKMLFYYAVHQERSHQYNSVCIQRSHQYDSV